MRRVLAISSIGNQPHNLHGKYIPGSGVGASSVSTRRLKSTRSAQCYAEPKTVYLRVSDIASYYDPIPGDTNPGYWILNKNTIINSYQYLIIYLTEDLHIPYNMTFTNNGQVDNNGSFYLENNDPGTDGSIVYNTGKFNNYGSLEINPFCKFYTYGGGSVYNSTAISAPVANIVVEGLFAIPPTVASGCGSGTFTGKDVYTGSVSYICP